MSAFKSLFGKLLGFNQDNQLLARDGIAAGGNGQPVIAMPDNKRYGFFEDFVTNARQGANDTGYAGDHFVTKLSDTGDTKFTYGAGSNGVFQIRFDGDTGTVLVSTDTGGTALIHGTQKWTLNRDNDIRMVTRLKVGSISRTDLRQQLFVGFTDDTGIAEISAYDTGNGVITPAADAVGLLWSYGADTGWTAVSAKSTAGDSGDQTVVLGATTNPVANTYQTLEVVLRRSSGDTGSAAHFYVDGKLGGSIVSPFATSTSLVPVVASAPNDTGGGMTVMIDYVSVMGTRDTGGGLGFTP